MTAEESSPSDSTLAPDVPLAPPEPRPLMFALHPVRSFAFGLAMIALGILAALLARSQGDPAHIAGWLLAAPSLVGALFLILAAVRWPWYRAFVRRYGRSPLPPRS